MQANVRVLETDYADTVGEPMEKQPISRPNAPAKSDVDRVTRRFERLGNGMDFVDAVIAAGISRATAFRLQNGEASVATLRKFEEWVVKQESVRGIRSSEIARSVEEWTELGDDLAKLDPERFNEMLTALRAIVGATKTIDSAMRTMFRPR